jgi:zinc protease
VGKLTPKTGNTADHQTNNVKPTLPNDWSDILDQVREYQLDNGLKLLTLKKKGLGSVVFDIYYAGGSSIDPPGRPGLSHFLEHMLYDGTTQLQNGQIDQVMFKASAQHNAETGADYCHFWCQLPREGLPLAFAIEADRMTGAILSRQSIELERSIILEEEARYREQPFDELMNRMMAEIYHDHPYQFPVIGTAESIRAISQADLKTHYDHVIRPANAVIVITGDFSSEKQCLKLAEKYFGQIPDQPSAMMNRPIDPPRQTHFDGRKIISETEEIVPRGVLIWPAPGPFDQASKAWPTAASILGQGRSSRLWQKLVEELQIAAFVGISLSDERQGGYLAVDIELNPGSSHEAAEAAILETIQQLAFEGPTPDELRRVGRARSASARWSRQFSANLATTLGTWAICDDWHHIAEVIAREETVDSDGVVQVISSLKESQKVCGWTLPAKRRISKRHNQPTNNPAPQKSLDLSALAEVPQPFARMATNACDRSQFKIAGKKPTVHQFGNGMTLLRERTNRQRLAAIELRWRTGWVEEAIPGLAMITARMCEEIVVPQTGQKLVEYLESDGVTLESGASGFAIQGREEELNFMLESVYLLMTSTRFEPDRFARVIRTTMTELEADLDDPSFRAETILREMVYGDGPGGHDARGTLESLKRMKLDDVIEHRRRYHNAPNAIIGISSEVQRLTLFNRFRKLESGLQISPGEADLIQSQLNTAMMIRPPQAARLQRLRSPGLQTHLVIGQLTVPRTDPDWVALQVLEIILGNSPGNADLLSRRLREELGLVYSVSAAMTEGAWRWPGYMRISMSCDPADTEVVQREALAVISQVAHGDISDESLCCARDYLRNTWHFGLESADDRLSAWLDQELYGWDLSDPPTWIKQCDALTPERIRSAAQRWIRPQMLQIVRFGPNE